MKYKNMKEIILFQNNRAHVYINRPLFPAFM